MILIFAWEDGEPRGGLNDLRAVCLKKKEVDAWVDDNGRDDLVWQIVEVPNGRKIIDLTPDDSIPQVYITPSFKDMEPRTLDALGKLVWAAKKAAEDGTIVDEAYD